MRYPLHHSFFLAVLIILSQAGLTAQNAANRPVANHPAGLSKSSAEFQQLEGRSFQRQSNATQSQPPARAAAYAPFWHGVASGDPLPDGVIIWTRVTPESATPQPVEVSWRMASDATMLDVRAEGTATATELHDYTVKVDVAGLQPNTFYYYQFEAFGRKSLIGRTRTAPSGSMDRLRIAAVSCSDYRAGYFHAYARLAERNDLSLIVHLGDYFYEGGGGPDGREHEPDAEIYRLQDYRARYSQYHLDPDLQRAHQVHPWSTIWDDHDIVVDALRDTSLRHNSAFGPYSARKWAAVQAAKEWLPLRDDPVDSFRIWRSLSFGDLGEVFLLDTRLYDRDRFAADASDPIYQTPDHRLIGPAQMAWLQSGLATSTSQWKILANQVMMGHLSALEDDPIIFENWAGYTAERDALYNYLKDNDIENTVVLTGDFHISMALDLAPNPRLPENYNPETGEGSLAVEFLVTSVTGENFDEGETYGFENAASASFLISLGNKHIKWSDLVGHGYVLLDLNADRAQAEFWHMQDITDPNNQEETAVILFKTDQGSQQVSRSFELSLPIQGLPALPPTDTVAANSAAEPTLLSAGPNPFTTEFLLNVWIPATTQVELSVHDATGKRIAYTPSQQIAPGNYLIRQPANGWAPGMYIADLLLNGEHFQRKLVKTQ